MMCITAGDGANGVGDLGDEQGGSVDGCEVDIMEILYGELLHYPHPLQDYAISFVLFHKGARTVLKLFGLQVTRRERL